MIRRDIRLANGAPGWMLISQIEHARISAELAKHCAGRFGAAPERAGASPPPAAVRHEVLAAIAHHDDGWADWERAPRLDLKRGRPLSFMELEFSAAIDIWTMSIGAAEEQGPLALWMVAGHFARLLKNSEHAKEYGQAAHWLAGVQLGREECLASWQAINPSAHTREVADEALQWLWTFDELSLWLCSRSPSSGESHRKTAGHYSAGRGTPIEMQLRSEAAGAEVDPARGVAIVSPWRFTVDAIDVEATGSIVPAAAYRDARDLLAAATPSTIGWRLLPGNR